MNDDRKIGKKRDKVFGGNAMENIRSGTTDGNIDCFAPEQ
jgi:hypothetical protein